MSTSSKLAIALALCGVVAVVFLTSGLQHQPRRVQRGPAKSQTKTTVVSNAQGDFVGSNACKECHQEIYDKYQQSPMGQSLTTVELAANDPHRGFENAAFKAGSREYQVTVDGETMVHSERLLDKDGKEVFEQKKQIAYVLGSGLRGKSYLIREHDQLFQSPIGWYSQQGGHWDLSPGYRPGDHPRFSRVIGDGCLYCHAGHTNTKPDLHDRYHDPVFHELSISCERCHGPGSEHVAFHSSVQPAGEDPLKDAIVNPAKLEDPALRDNVCIQCHLLGQSVVRRKGKNFFSFRPGERLEETFVMLERPQTMQGSAINAVSQVEQMRSSKCYTASAGELGCTSCHDPHSSPSPEERIAHFRDRCLQCHQDQDCGEAEPVRAAELNSCIQCHMPRLPTADVPHTSLTHHGIIRPGDPLQLPNQENMLQVFEGHADALPENAVDRAMGISMMSGAWSINSKELATEAMRRLLEAMPISPEPLETRLKNLKDPDMLQELGSGYFLLEQYNMAELCWRRLLEINPENTTGLIGLAKLAWLDKDIGQFRPLLEKLAAAAPSSEEYLLLELQLSFLQKDVPRAIEWGEKLVKQNPTRISSRQLLEAAYRKAGETEKAEAQADTVKKLQAVQERDVGPPAF